MKRVSKVALGMFALVISATAVCSLLPHLLYGKRIAGQVLDAATGEPIARAHVAFLWESGIKPKGFTGHNSRDICYRAAATMTDEQGRFTVAAWKQWSTFDVDVHDPIALVYAPRYTPMQFSLKEGKLVPPKERPNERYALNRFAGTVDERLNVMWWGIANHGCSYGGDSQKSLFPMLKAMYDEAKQIATTAEQMKEVYSFSAMAARAAIAPDPNGPANASEIDQFIKERLQ